MELKKGKGRREFWYVPWWQRIPAIDIMVETILKCGEGICELKESLTGLFEGFEVRL